jgi:uncharacterized protein (TIGR00725 family)
MAEIRLSSKPYQIGVFGSGSVDSRVYKLAYDVGAEIARQGHIMISGGLDGVMEASSHGAAEAGGLVIGLLPGDDFAEGNDHSTVKILTAMKYARNHISGLSCHGAIVIGGSSGAYEEARKVWEGRGPVVVLADSGSKTGAGETMISRQETLGLAFPENKPKPWKIFVAKSPADAVQTVIKLMEKNYPNDEYQATDDH